MRVTADKIKHFLFDKGELHDCRITGILWKTEQDKFELSILDMNANQAGLPEYPGPKPALIVFEGIQSVQADITLDGDKLRIYETVFSMDGDLKFFDFHISPTGKIAVQSRAISIEFEGTN